MKPTKTLVQAANDIENGNNLHEYNNDRDYQRDKDAQMITRKIAAEYDARAIQSPVIVSRDGVVLSGNGDTLNEKQCHVLNFMADDLIKIFWDKE